MPYDAPQNLTLEGMEAELRRLHAELYPYFGNPAYVSDDFDTMVTKFADDAFYRYHYFAREYLEKRNSSVS